MTTFRPRPAPRTARTAAREPATASDDHPLLHGYKLPQQLPEIYYEAPRRAFWAKNDTGQWVEYPANHIRLVLVHDGVRSTTLPGEKMNPLEQHFYALRQRHDVHWAGPLAGFQPGIHDLFGTRVLVTSGPQLIKAKAGRWPTIRTWLEAMLGEKLEGQRKDSLHQLDVLYAWIKSGLRSLLSGAPFRPGQSLAIAGPSDCGKSLLQNLLTEIFGGRSAKPYRYMIGESSFNAELIGAEHMMIEDDATSTDLRTRRQFGAKLKSMIACEVVSFHPKGKNAMSVQCFWRVTISMNDEAENLMVLPPLDDSMRDKLSLLRARANKKPFPEDNLTERRAYRQKLTSELPAFLDFLHRWQIPRELKDQRYGAKAWQNAELVREVELLQPEFKLWQLIHSLEVWMPGDTVWEGTAAQLEARLIDRDRSGMVKQLLSYNTACGVYLGRLRRHFKDQISSERGENNTLQWTIRKK